MLNFGFKKHLSLMQYEAVVLSLAPLFYYRCNEVVGSTNLYSAGNTNPIQIAGAGTTLESSGLLSNDSDKSVLFNGAGYAYSVAPQNSYTLGGNDWSIALLVRYSSDTFSTILALRTNGLASILCLITTSRISAGDISAETWSWGVASTRVRYNGVNNNATHHVVVSYIKASNTLHLYVDGTLRDSRVQSDGTFTSNPLYFYLGSNYGGAQMYTGNVDEVSMFNYALSGTQISNLANTALIGPA